MAPSSCRLAFMAVMLLIATGFTSAKSSKARVRKELRQLSDRELRQYYKGLSTMLSVPTAAGQKIFGPLYKDYDYFVVKHAVSVYDPRGDQGHFGPHFIVFHRAITLEFENALLSVVPDLKAAPYWDITLDSVDGGKYYNTSKYIFTNKYAGSMDGNPDYNYTVTDGPLGWKRVGHFNPEVYSFITDLYNGSTTTGLLRSKTNTNPNPYLTRYPTINILQKQSENPRYASMALGFNFTLADWDKCINPKVYTSWYQWNWCIDLAVGVTFNETDTVKYLSGNTDLFHTSGHWVVGSFDATDGTMGDMYDVTTSPNEVLLFMAHHMNLDRSNMIWMKRAQDLDPRMADPSVMWGFPKTQEDYSYGYNGTFLHDVINARFPFTDLFGKFKKGGLTHFEVIDATRPGKAPYTYDKMF